MLKLYFLNSIEEIMDSYLVLQMLNIYSQQIVYNKYKICISFKSYWNFVPTFFFLKIATNYGFFL